MLDLFCLLFRFVLLLLFHGVVVVVVVVSQIPEQESGV
jgi:hypothetical protein